ncbi:cyclic nucleotide-binding domain-containing protein [Roseimicrobium sp. ORNL1]|uniref:cyclic nucleotide-binding domain-containing protein n=1 Tax=Roseimicrobium sp. ORNL1 TaxID=2711231 RepID=UPI0013E14B6C|nr:cyclic nucleotide-binding domain-containing protein [Roseimicrobium sp. ORNL1]QIF05307.1 cyclic nucleotide-binding domain-containing protein [Roseimicrobium sp. ORNL1]
MKEYAFIHEHGQVPDSLRTVPFLESFSDEQLDDVLNSSSYIHCEPEDVIIQEGAVDSRIYILLNGVVDVRKDGKTLATIKRPGEVFGELAVVNDDRRSASVVAAKPTVCLAVDQKFLQDVKPRDEYPAFYAALYEFIARVTAGRLQATSRRLAEVEKELRELKASLAAEGGESSEPSAPAAPPAKTQNGHGGLKKSKAAAASKPASARKPVAKRRPAKPRRVLAKRKAGRR